MTMTSHALSLQTQNCGGRVRGIGGGGEGTGLETAAVGDCPDPTPMTSLTYLDKGLRSRLGIDTLRMDENRQGHTDTR